jgi:hypothetical protein
MSIREAIKKPSEKLFKKLSKPTVRLPGARTLEIESTGAL